jgi:hypothetical protein
MLYFSFRAKSPVPRVWKSGEPSSKTHGVTSVWPEIPTTASVINPAIQVDNDETIKCIGTAFGCSTDSSQI